MVKRFRAGASVLLALFLFSAMINLYARPGQAAQSAGAGQPRADSHVIMISIDGLVPEYYTAPSQAGLRAPNLVRMKLEGAWAGGVEGVYPSVTYPAHTTLVTGVRPALHGIVQNRIFEPPTATQTREWYFFARDLKAETLWMLAKRAGLTTGAVGWPVTVEAEIDHNVPEIFDPLERPATPRRSLQYSTPGLIAKAVASGITDTTTDGRRTALSEFIITTYKPNLMLIHLVELDGAHHTYGTRSPQAVEIAERIDGYIGRIVEATRKAGIFEKTTFLIVSDHGFAKVEKRFAPGVALVKEKLITLDEQGKATDWKAAPWPAGGSCAIVLRNPDDKETARKVADIFDRVASRNNSPLNRVLKRDEIKKLGSIPEAELMLDAAPGYTFGEELSGAEIEETKNYRGTHGQLPTRADMRSSLIVYGAAARVGARIPIARMIDIAPTAAAILGLKFTKAEGLPVSQIIK
jgi:predicted AlkP superfamily pyrophosphatase or phosphodiesterase